MKKQTPIISVDVGGKGPSLGDFYGIFFEDLNHAADGGLYAQMIQNPSFEFGKMDNRSYDNSTGWTTVGDADVRYKNVGGVFEKNPWYAEIAGGPGAGLVNGGYNGMYIENGKTYNLSFFAKGAMRIAVSLVDENGGAIGTQELQLTDDWARYEVSLSAIGGALKGGLSFCLMESGRIALDAMILLPADADGIFRPDLLEALKELKPKFMRFPGGCLVHDGDLDPSSRTSCYCWKNTLGAPEARGSRRNNWGYNQTLGLGYYEYFILCEKLGCEPLPVLPAGWNPHSKKACPEYDMGLWINDALDLVEFANGGTDTVWGKVRSELGHPAPFGLKYLAIGNEEVGEEFPPRYELIAKAVREKYPKIKLIHSAGPFPAGSEYKRGWSAARKAGADLIDEHYYTSPQWMLANIDRYAGFSNRKPKVFLGEYASWGSTMFNALAEAAYMTGLENSAHAVSLTCYAPLFCNVDYKNWSPDLIYFDNHRVCRSLSYYVQKLFSNNQPDSLLPFTTDGVGTASPIVMPILGKLEIGSCGAEGRITDARIINLDNGDTVSFGDIDISADTRRVLSEINLPDCEFCFKFTKTGGGWNRGIQLNFGMKDQENRICWDLGGWQNQDCMITSVVDGRGTCLDQSLFTLEGGREYDLCLKIKGRKITTLIDGIVVNQCEDKIPEIRDLYVTAGKIKSTGEVVVKAVNINPRKFRARLELGGGAWKGKVWTLSGKLEDENSFESESAPVETEFSASRGGLTMDFPAQSLTVIRIKKEK